MFVDLLAILFIISFFIFLNALYVTAEFATAVARRPRISHMADQGSLMAKLLLPILEDAHKRHTYIAAGQVGMTVSLFVVGAFGQQLVASWLSAPLRPLLTAVVAFFRVDQANLSPNFLQTASQTIALVLVLLTIATFHVIIGELLPKSIAIHQPEKWATAWYILLPMLLSRQLFAPFVWLFSRTAQLIVRLSGRDYKKVGGFAHSPDEIELLVTESYESGLLDDEERRMLRNAFRLRDLTARQVMVHRTKILAAPVQTPIVELMQMAIGAGYSRIPIYKEQVDDVIGFVHVKDLFRLHVEGMATAVDPETAVRSILRDVVYVPETLAIADVWQRLDARRKYLAIVFDEYGGTSGLITFEDLIEEIFGELQDEFDNELAPYARDKQGRVYLRGDLLVVDVNEYWELALPEEIADTLSGLMFSELRCKPQIGDEVSFDQVTLRVETLEDQAVSELSLLLPQTSTEEPVFVEWEEVEHE